MKSLRRSCWKILLVPLVLLLSIPRLVADRVALVAGGGQALSGRATNCVLHSPFGIDFDRDGNIFIVEMAGGERIVKVDRKGMLSTIAGTGEKGNSGDDRPAVGAQFNGMHSLAAGPANDFFLADTWNNRIRRLDLSSGKIFALAGSGHKGFAGDNGRALAAEFGGIYCVALDARREKIFLADLDNRRVRAIDLKTGLVRTVAGNGEKGVPADGAEASQSPLIDPRAVAVDSQGRLYILERSGHALRVVDRNGKIRTVAGTGKKGLSGDGGDALQATLNGPKHICLDAQDNVVIADTDNHVIRKFLPKEGRIVRVAGSGRMGTAGVGGPPEALELNQPHGVRVDKSGVLYIADSLNNRVLKIER